MRLKIGQNRDHHIAVNAAYPRTSHISSTPSKALTMPAIRSDPSGVSSALAASRLASPGDAAKINPSMASTRPIATRKSRIAKTSGRGLLLGTLVGSACGPLGPASLLGCARASLAARIAEEAEEIRIGPQQQAGVALLQSLLVRLHRAIEREEIRVATIGL